MDLVEQHRDQRAHQTGNDHGHDQRQPDAAGQQKGRGPDIALEKVDVAAQKAQGHHGQNGTVQKTHTGLLPEQLQFFGKGQVFVHQHTDGHRQRLGTDVTGHIQHHGLEADDHRQHRYHRFKRADDRGDQHPEEQQRDQPRETLFHAFKYVFVQILLAGQTTQLCVIIAHLIVDQLDHIGRGDDAHQLTGIVQHRQAALRVVHDAVDTVADLLPVGDIGIGADDQAFQTFLCPGNDEVFQVDGAVEVLVFIHHIQGGDVVVFSGLLYQLAHRLPDGHIVFDGDVVGGHPAADLVLVIGEQHLHIFHRVLVQLVDDLVFIGIVKILQCVHRIVRVHVGNDLGGLVAGQLLQIRLGIVQIGKDLGNGIHTQNGIERLAFGGGQRLQRIRQIFFMVIRQFFSQFRLGQTAVNDAQNFLYIILLHG